MLTSEEREFIYHKAYVPEHLPDYVEAIAGAEPFLHEGYLCFVRTGRLIFVGYPLHGESDRAPVAYESACKRFRPSSVAIVAPTIWVEANALNGFIEDSYYRLQLPLAALTTDLSYMVRRASRELTVVKGTFVKDHKNLIDLFIAARQVSAGHREIFSRIPKYLLNSSTAVVLEARRGEELVAFNIIDLGSIDHCFYLFNFRSLKPNVPGACDLLFFEMARLAEAEEKKTLNLGLGINAGVRRFKEKWGAVPFLPHVAATVRTRRVGLFDFIRMY